MHLEVIAFSFVCSFLLPMSNAIFCTKNSRTFQKRDQQQLQVDTVGNVRIPVGGREEVCKAELTLGTSSSQSPIVERALFGR